MTPNLSAFLALIRQCETGTTGPESYRTLYGGGKFDSFADHPRQRITAGGYTSTAAGAYQILSVTWDDFCKATGAHDFSPPNQDLCARWLIDRRHATALVEQGRIPEAITLCGQEWASLPGSPYGQPTRTLDYCLQVYQQNGGTVNPSAVSSPSINRPSVNSSSAGFVARALAEGMQYATEERDGAPTPAGPLPDRKETQMVPFLPILASLLPSVLQLFSGRAQAAIAKAADVDPSVAQPLVQQIFTGLQQAVGVPITNDATAIQAVGKVTSGATSDDAATKAAMLAKVAEIEQHALDWLDKIAPLVDKIAEIDLANLKAADDSRDRAAARGASPEGWRLRFSQASWTQKALGYGAAITAVLILVMSVLLVWLPDDTHAAVLNLIGQFVIVEVALITGLIATFRDQNGFSFGGTVQDHATPLGVTAVNQALDERRNARTQ